MIPDPDSPLKGDDTETFLPAPDGIDRVSVLAQGGRELLPDSLELPDFIDDSL